jgi:phage protein D
VADLAYKLALNDEAVDNAVYADIISLTVEEQSDGPSTLQFRLTTNRKDDGSWRYLDDDRFALFTKISVKLGFTHGGGLGALLGALAGAFGSGGSGNDGLDAVFDGYITSVDVNLGSQSGGSHLDLTAMDTSVLLSLEEKIVTWPNLADSDIVQQIVSGYGVQVKADTTPTVHQERDTTIMQRGTDIQLVRELAQRNGHEFYFETDKDSSSVVAYFRAPQLDGTPQPDLAIQFGDQSNLRSFSARVIGQRPLNVKTQQLDVKANSTNTAQVSDTQLTKLGDKDVSALVGGPLGALVTPKDAQAQMLVLGPPTSDATELRTVAQAVRDEAGWFITATGEVNGNAYQAVLRPRRLVLIKGAGKPFSGKYYVTSVVHELKMDTSCSYTQRFEARRNARDLDGSENFGSSGMGLALPGL